MKLTTSAVVVSAALVLGCGGGGNGTHKTSFPMKDEVTKPKPSEAKVPVAKSLKDLVGGQMAAIDIVGAGPHLELLRKIIGTKTGDAFNTARVGWDIRAIWATGKVDDVKVKGLLVGAGKVKLIYTVKPRATVRSVVFKGNKGIASSALGALIKFKDGEVLNMVKVHALRDAIGQHYTEQGYLLATVKATTVPAPKSGDRVNVQFEIIERARIQIAKIKVLGVSAFRARKLLPLIREKSGANAVGGAYVAAKFRRALLRVTDDYYNRGFINVVVREPKVSFLAKNKKRLTVSVRITEGKRFRVGKLSIKGALKAPARVYFQKLGLRRGWLFSRAKVVKAIERLVAFQKTKGVAKPNVVPVTKIHEKRSIIDLTFEIR